MFMTSKLRAGYKLLRKKTGLRYVMDVIPLDATLIRGSHGSLDVPEDYYPVLLADEIPGTGGAIDATGVYDVIWKALSS
jgi:hypothetical protein